MSVPVSTMPALERFRFDDLQNQDAYRQWRARKLRHAPGAPGDLVVEVRDPRALTEAERDAILDRCRNCNMAIYASSVEDDPDKDIPRRVGQQLGLTDLDSNWLADDDGITSLTVNPEGSHPFYIPYTDRPIHWHTDGYYNPTDRQIEGLLLHCVHPAAEGGENALLDPEIAYLFLRDANPAYIDALFKPDAMTIPARTEAGDAVRPDSVGPVFSISSRTGALHMRYTARTRSIRWSNDPIIQQATRALTELLDSTIPYIYRARLESGMGLISNNVLHDRAGFKDAPEQPARLLYRARYHQRIAGT